MKLPSPPTEYSDPIHVGVLQLLSLLGFVSGVWWCATSKLEPDQMAFGLGALIGAMYLAIFAGVARNAARAAWQSARTAHQLQPVIDEVNRQIDAREAAERATEHARAADIERVIAARQATKN